MIKRMVEEEFNVKFYHYEKRLEDHRLLWPSKEYFEELHALRDKFVSSFKIIIPRELIEMFNDALKYCFITQKPEDVSQLCATGFSLTAKSNSLFEKNSVLTVVVDFQNVRVIEIHLDGIQIPADIIFDGEKVRISIIGDNIEVHEDFMCIIESLTLFSNTYYQVAESLGMSVYDLAEEMRSLL